MSFENVCIESIAYSLPCEKWTSEGIEKRLQPLYDRLNLPFGRLELMTGIRERRMWEPGTLPSEASAKAGRELLKKTGIPLEKMDLLIHAGVCRDRLEPATAAYVHRLLNLPRQMAFFDLSNACLGFINAMSVAGGLIESGQIRSALIVAGENGRPLVERTIQQLLAPEMTRHTIKPFFANLTIGCGAVAALLCHSSLVDGKAPRLLGGAAEAATEYNDLCEGDTTLSPNELEMQTNSEDLLVAGVGVAWRNWEQFKGKTHWTADTADRVITHQVGSAHRRKLFETLGLSLEKDFSTFETLGNIGSVSLPVSLALAAEKGVLNAGDKIALLGIGSGISSMMLALEWG
ncbi:MAG: 3-oxoacyl-ACP synthase III [Opitutales bacterium]